MSLISNFVIISILVAIFYCVGFLTFITDHGENKCEMTYMFEYPQFVTIKLPAEDRFPRYGLYAYSEGKLTLRARDMEFDGIPVLFIPGNGGSYKQVRSLASVALRKALHSRVGYHFDFFSLDLNDELSGLNGAVLNEQTSFLNHSLYQIINLYSRKKPNARRSVILIGHSMGGVIAHSILGSSENLNQIEMLITLASPHRRPTISLDNYIAEYYEQIERINSSNLANKTFISIGGGNNDHLVNSGLTYSNYSSLNVLTTTIPTVWLSMDHQCITWCKQLILTVIRALFDSVDLKTRQLSSNHNYRLAAFKHHLLKNSGTNVRWADRYKVISRLDDKGEWREDLRRQYTVTFPRGTNHNQWHMIRILNDPKHQALFVQAINLRVVDWIYACTASSVRGQMRYCENGIHLSHLTKIAPSSKYKRRTHYVDLFKLKKRYPKITHVVVRVLPTQDPVSISYDVHNLRDRTVNVNLPRWFSLTRTTVIDQTEPEALRYEIQLNGLQHVIQMYLLYVVPVECTAETHHATASLSVPWAQHDTHTYFTETSKKPLQLRLHSSRPLHQTNATAKVYLTLDPTCRYTISVRNSFFGMLGQFARYYSPLLIANIAAVILMSYRSQLVCLEENRYCSLFQTSVSMSTKPYYLITSAKLLSRVLSFSRLSNILPVPDAQVLIDENIDFLILPLLLYVTSVGLTYMLSVILWACIILSESTVHKFIAKFITRTIGGAVKWSDWLLNAVHRVPCVVAATLLCLGISTCGGLALCLGVAYYFLKLTQQCQDYLEGLAYRYVKTIISKIIGRFFKRSKKNETKDETAQQSSQITENTNNETEKMNEVCQEKSMDENDEQCSSKTVKTIEHNSVTETNKQNSTNVDDRIEDVKEETNNEEVNDEEVMKDNEINNIRLRTMNSESVNNENNDNHSTEHKNEEANTINKENESSQEPKKNRDNSNHSEIHFHFTLFLMWLLVAALNIPSVLTWAHNFHYSNVLRPDPSSLYGIVLCLCAMPLWQMELPKTNKRFYKHMGMFVYCMALTCLIYAPLNIYRLSYILTATLAVTTLHQLFAPCLSEDETEDDDDNDEPDPIALIEDIKTKLE